MIMDLSISCFAKTKRPVHWFSSVVLALSLAFAAQAHALVYEWEFERGGGFYSNTFIEGDIFAKALDGEVDVMIKQSSAFNISDSVISITYLDGNERFFTSKVVNPGAETDCDKDTHVGCVEKLKSEEVEFKHFYIDLKDVLNLKTEDISFASLTLIGSGLNFDDPDLEVKWDWSSHLGRAHNLPPPSPVPEPSILFLLLIGMIPAGFLLRARSAAHPVG